MFAFISKYMYTIHYESGTHNIPTSMLLHASFEICNNASVVSIVIFFLNIHTYLNQ